MPNGVNYYKVITDLQGQGTYEYKCVKKDCFWCEYMSRENAPEKEYATRNYGWGVIPIKKYQRKKSA